MFRFAAYFALVSGLFFVWAILPRPLTFPSVDLSSLNPGHLLDKIPLPEQAAREAALPCGSTSSPCPVGQRDYHIALPAGDGPHPVIVMLHGSGGSGAETISSALRRNAISRGYGLIAPSALDIQYNTGNQASGWLFEGRRGTRDDFQYIRNVLSDAASRYPIDPSRIMLAGHSNGATFAMYYACASTRAQISHVATVGGTLARGRPEACGRRTPRFSLLHTHGDRDPVLPIEGSLPENGWIGWEAAAASLDVIRSKAGCQQKRGQTYGAFSVDLWSDCLGEQKFGLATFSGGHEIPAGWIDFIIDWAEGKSSPQ